MGRLGEGSGFVRGGLLVLLLLLVVGILYLNRRRGEEVTESGKEIDLEQAVANVRQTSEDALLTAKVKAALALSRSAPALDLDVDSHDGTVSLTGILPSQEAKRKASRWRAIPRECARSRIESESIRARCQR